MKTNVCLFHRLSPPTRARALIFEFFEFLDPLSFVFNAWNIESVYLEHEPLVASQHFIESNRTRRCIQFHLKVRVKRRDRIHNTYLLKKRNTWSFNTLNINDVEAQNRRHSFAVNLSDDFSPPYFFYFILKSTLAHMANSFVLHENRCFGRNTSQGEIIPQRRC